MKVVAAVIGLLAALGIAAPALASAPPPPPTYTPQSGPPGTVVHVSGITLCDRDGGTTGQIGFASSQAALHTPDSFTPPHAEITIPQVANGDYFIYLLCGGGTEAMRFTVTGSNVVAAPEPVNTAPIFTG